MHIAICDDERIFINKISKLINHPDAEILAFDSGSKLLECKEKIDIVLLDIEMPGINGLEVAEKLYLRNKDIIIVFVTSHNEYSTVGYRYRAFRYILKSEPDIFIKRDIDEAIEEYENNNVYLYFHYKQASSKASVGDIVYFEADNHTYKVNTVNKGSCMHYGKFKDLERKVEKYGFVRIHRSTIVNLRYVEVVDDEKGVRVWGDTWLSIGKKYSKKLEDRFNEYKGGRI